MANNLYANVTARILSELETGAAPWVKDWSATPGQNVPCNAATNRAYSGCNVVLLWLSHGRFATPRFLTYKQATELGGHVKKGEHGFTVYFVKQMTAKPKDGEGETEDGRTFTMLRAYTVFNVGQCEGLPDRVVSSGEVKVRNEDERDATIDEFIAATGANYSETGGDKAFYQPATDRVCMPQFGSFNAASSYYATAFHELGHWTGSDKRLNRQFGKRFGDKQYAAEELVAELTSAFLCAEFSLKGNLRHAGYIEGWIRMLKDDNRAFFTAASAAQKAADYLREKALAEVLPIAA